MTEDKSVLPGSTSMLLLQLLSERDMYGYEAIEILQERSEFVFNLKVGTIYPLLHTMGAKRLLVPCEREAQGKMRGYYLITREGRGALAKKKEDWNTYSKAMEHVIGGALYESA